MNAEDRRCCERNWTVNEEDEVSTRIAPIVRIVRMTGCRSLQLPGLDCLSYLFNSSASWYIPHPIRERLPGHDIPARTPSSGATTQVAVTPNRAPVTYRADQMF